MAARHRCPGRDTHPNGTTTPCPHLLPPGTRYCPTHARTYEARRGSPTARGHGTPHRRERSRWQARIDAGEIIYCADGCGQQITGTAWQLGHNEDRTRWIGPQTITCNTSEGGRAATDPNRRRR